MGHGLAYDEARQRVVMFGGCEAACLFNPSELDGGLDDTWEWNGDRWIEVTPATTRPTRFVDAELVYDDQRGFSLLFQGIGPGTVPLPFPPFTRTWNGSDWGTPTLGAEPSARRGVGLAYDRGSGTAVLFGGSTSDSTTYLWGSGGWAGQTTTPAPPPGGTMPWPTTSCVCVQFCSAAKTTAGCSMTCGNEVRPRGVGARRHPDPNPRRARGTR